MPMRRCSGGTNVPLDALKTERSLTEISPASGCSNPATQRGRFAAAAWPEKCEKLAFLNFKRHAAQGADFTFGSLKGFHQISYLNHSGYLFLKGRPEGQRPKSEYRNPKQKNLKSENPKHRVR